MNSINGSPECSLPTADDSISTLSSSTSSTSTAHQSDCNSSSTPHHWRPHTERLGGLMAEAKRLAEVRHAELQAKKALRKPNKADSRKRKRTLNKRAESSLRSAEICREKFQIYPKLLEREVQHEEQVYLDLISRSFEMTAKIVRLNQQVAEAERRAESPVPAAANASVALPPVPQPLGFDSMVHAEEEVAAADALDDFWSDYSGSDETDVCHTDEPTTPVDQDPSCGKMEDILIDEKTGEHCTPTSILDASSLGVPELFALPESVLALKTEPFLAY